MDNVPIHVGAGPSLLPASYGLRGRDAHPVPGTVSGTRGVHAQDILRLDTHSRQGQSGDRLTGGNFETCHMLACTSIGLCEYTVMLFGLATGC